MTTRASAESAALGALLRGIDSRRLRAPAPSGRAPVDAESKAADAAPGGARTPKVRPPKVRVAGDGLSALSRDGVGTFDALAEHAALRVPPWLARGAQATTLGAATLTPVQRHAIPILLEGRDCIAIAPTGSGKTLAFLVPCVAAALRAKAHARRKQQRRSLTSPGDAQKQDEQDAVRGPFAVILSPTRELASQTARELRRLAAKAPRKRRLTVSLLTKRSLPSATAASDPEASNPQGATAAAAADVVVATPPRLAQIAQEGALSLGRVRLIVLDEADKLFAAGEGTSGGKGKGKGKGMGKDGARGFLEHVDAAFAAW